KTAGRVEPRRFACPSLLALPRAAAPLRDNAIQLFRQAAFTQRCQYQQPQPLHSVSPVFLTARAQSFGFRFGQAEVFLSGKRTTTSSAASPVRLAEKNAPPRSRRPHRRSSPRVSERLRGR